ncbi:hypothetical protein FOJ82_15120 [Tessaracoccus rhinocerotis]|uniref:DUF4230 domain-containing protein n=1 Tax=Tessaracoccus rhinocerotis TaxID=1689449 RepID=A0A553JW91_9ACTN|nr:hypothetical protein [Tessaracoccus rhinocerotis]TRY16719.1 hypothetical protein FOJ82_15120 [Tessaracoccus rhinocerotis]
MASKVNALLTAGVGVTALALGLAVGVGAPRMLPELFGTSEQVRNEQIVRSIERLDQVVLVSLGIQGIAEQSANSEIFGVAVPGSTRTMFLQYSFNAKLGLNGEDVVIEQTGEDGLLITIPEFEFIGHSDEEFRLVTEDNGVTSFVTPEIDPITMINEILNDDAKDQHVEDNDDILTSQAEAFYTGIVSSIDPELDVEFAYAQH